MTEADLDLEDAMAECEDLEDLVDSRPSASRSARRWTPSTGPGPILGRLRDAFDRRDAGEALVGSFVFGIRMALVFENAEADLRLGVVPRRLVATLAIAFGLALVRMTTRGLVDWVRPAVAASQTLVTRISMAIGASLGDILPGT